MIDISKYRGHTPRPWKWWTSNSVMRLSAGRKDGNVLRAYPIDGDADIIVSEVDSWLIEDAPEILAELIQDRALIIELTTALNRERARNAELSDSVELLTNVIDAHEIETLDCDRREEKYCNCLNMAIAKACAARNKAREATL